MSIDTALVSQLTNLSNRGKQAFGALCLAQFCAKRQIQHAALHQLIEHLLNVLISSNLPIWERDGATLQLTGRGDPIPRDLLEVLSRCSGSAKFVELVTNVVEVGLSDMYSADTSQPLEHLLKTVSLLQANCIPLPELGVIFACQTNIGEHGAWGKPVGPETYAAILQQFRHIYPRRPG